MVHVDLNCHAMIIDIIACCGSLWISTDKLCETPMFIQNSSPGGRMEGKPSPTSRRPERQIHEAALNG